MPTLPIKALAVLALGLVAIAPSFAQTTHPPRVDLRSGPSAAT